MLLKKKREALYFLGKKRKHPIGSGAWALWVAGSAKYGVEARVPAPLVAEQE